MGHQEGSESTVIPMESPSLFSRMASAMLHIKNSAHELIPSIFRSNSGHAQDHNHDSKLDHDDSDPSYDPEAYGAPDLVNRSIGSPITSSPTRTSTAHFHRSTPLLSPSCPDCPNLCRECQRKTTLSNPMAQGFQERELAKSFMTFIMPITTILLSVPNKAASPQLLQWALFLICAAVVFLFWGGLLCDMYPKVASVFEQLGTACIYTSFFMAVGSHLPRSSAWFPFICFVACILPSFYICLTVKEKTVNAQKSVEP